MTRQMAAWPAASSYHTYRTGVDLGQDAALEVAVRPSGANYYLALTFAAGVDARRALRPPTTNPPPATSGGDKK